MPTFFVRTISGNAAPRGEWQEVEAGTAAAAVRTVCGYPVVEAIRRLQVCAEVRTGSKAAMGRFYRRG